uniref:Uncharacterized protein n=1 Tax=Arundo donax TaxID=35708 RepID=A0A0A9AF97_ARUDO
MKRKEDDTLDYTMGIVLKQTSTDRSQPIDYPTLFCSIESSNLVKRTLSHHYQHQKRAA